MDMVLADKIISMVKDYDKNFKGRIGFYFKDLSDGFVIEHNSHEDFWAASIIKLPIFADYMRRYSEGKFDLCDKLHVGFSDMVPGCGALRFFSSEIDVDIMTLLKLMITISDNTATNVLIDFVGLDELNEGFRICGMDNVFLRRKLFDSKAGSEGLENTFNPYDIGVLLEKIFNKEFISYDVSKFMEDVLMEQQINHKIPGKLCYKYPVAHKTGEDEELTNDVGIVYCDKPFVICFAGSDVDVPSFEELMREVTYEICNG